MTRRIVIAEDETLTRLDLKEMLIENGYDVVGEASDGLDALRISKEKNPDIVLLDIKMPLMSGLQVAKLLKEDGFMGCIIIFILINLNSYVIAAFFSIFIPFSSYIVINLFILVIPVFCRV